MKEPKLKLKSIEKYIPTEYTDCSSFHQKSFCALMGLKDECEWPINLKNKNLSKPGILIIDDNSGIVSFLEDDLEILDDEDKIDITKYNVFSFTSKMAGYKFIATIRKYGDLNIKYAIIDITLGGVVHTISKIIKLTGIDILEVLQEVNPDVRYLFYTGNQMNTFIKPIAEIMKQYKKLTKNDISDSILFKTELNMEDRQEYILKELLEK